MTSRYELKILPLLLVLVWTTACVNVEETNNPISDSLTGVGATTPPEARSRSEELSRIQFDDIPVPEGFFLRNHRNESFSYRFGDRRIGRFVYWGYGKRAELLRHFEAMMPKGPFGWKRGESSVQAASDRMTFVKTGQRCTVTLTPDAQDGKDEFLITIFVEST
ncbi:MAG: hypothetical protein V3W41_17105 [Planctomycetota bacterium]